MEQIVATCSSQMVVRYGGSNYFDFEPHNDSFGERGSFPPKVQKFKYHCTIEVAFSPHQRRHPHRNDQDAHS